MPVAAWSEIEARRMSNPSSRPLRNRVCRRMPSPRPGADPERRDFDHLRTLDVYWAVLFV